MHWIYLIHEFHNLSWITEINELFHVILIYWDAPVDIDTSILLVNYIDLFFSLKSAYNNIVINGYNLLGEYVDNILFRSVKHPDITF